MLDIDPTETFRQEATELLETLETTLLDLGQRPEDAELIDAAFRALHTIKGSGAMFGFDRVAAFTHDFETAFDLIRKGEAAADRDIVAVSLSAKDYIRTLIEAPESTDDVIGEAIVGELHRLVGGIAPGAGRAVMDEVVSADAAPAGWAVEIAFPRDALQNGTNPLGLLDELRDLGPCEVVAHLDEVPDLDVIDPKQCFIRWSVKLLSNCPRQAIEDVFMFASEGMTLTIEPIVADRETLSAKSEPSLETVHAREPAAKPAGEAASERAEPHRRADDKGSTVRVQAERLDELMDRVGELVIAQARLSQLAHGSDDLAIKAIAEEVERLASGLRDTTMGVRMVPWARCSAASGGSYTTSRVISPSRSSSSRSARTPRWTRP